MVVPRNKVNEMVEYLHNLHNEVDIRIKSFGHAGDTFPPNCAAFS